MARKLYAYLDTWTERPLKKFRLHAWFDIKKRCPIYGVQVQETSGRHFAHVIREDGSPILFQDEAKALEYAMQFVATRRPQEVSHA